MPEPRVDDETLDFCCDPSWVDEAEPLTVVRYRIALELRDRRRADRDSREQYAPLRRWEAV